MATIVEFPERGELANEAAQWLIRLDADSPPTQADLQALGEWLRRSPAHREELRALAELWGRMNILVELAVPLGNPDRSVTQSRFARIFTALRSPWRWATAGAVMLALIVLLFARGSVSGLLGTTNGLYATAVGQQRTTTLADGSQVMLNTNSQIKVDYGGRYRRVYLLQGEALFTVAKNAQRPFRVYAGNGLIEALGTSFSVHLKGADIDVIVTEGRVSLASTSQTPSAVRSKGAAAAQARIADAAPNSDIAPVLTLGVLKAGQTATIHTTSIRTSAVEASALEAVASIAPQEMAQRMAWREGILSFSGETLEEVVRELSRYTTVSIEIPDAATRSMRVGGRFPVGETDAMLAALATNFNLRVIHLSHNRVILAPAGQ